MFENQTFRKVLFGVLAVALLGLGGWATMHSSATSRDELKTEPGAVATVAPAPVVPSTTGQPTLDPVKAIKIAQPLSDTDLEAAAQAAKTFLTVYGSFDYREADMSARVEALTDGEATFDPATVMPRGLARAQMVAAKVVTKVSVEFRKVALTTAETASFVVRFTTVTTGGDGAGRHTDDISITMRRGGGGWNAYGLVLGDAFEGE